MENVIVFGKDSCKYCIKTKEWLSENQVPYLYKDISFKNYYIEFEKFNALGIPLIVVSSDENYKIIQGYSPEELEESLL